MTPLGSTTAFRTTRGVVVVSCDGSWDSRRAVEVAAQEAAHRRTSVVILALLSPRDLYPDRLADVIARERSALDRTEAVVRGAKEHARTVEPGVPVEVLVALEHSADLIALAGRTGLLVIGRQDRGGQATFSVGSSSSALSRAFRVPILITGGRPAGAGIPPHPKVVVGLTGGIHDPMLADRAISEACIRRWPLVAVRVLLEAAGAADDLREVLTAQAGAWEALRKSTRMAAVHVRTEVIRGDPVDSLVSHCGDEDLLVLGNGGLGHLHGVLPGSLTFQVINAAPCDVLIFPAVAAPASPERLSAGQLVAT